MPTPREDKTAPPPLLASRDALFLDFDGTLTEIAARPDQVYIESSLLALLERVRHLLGGAVAIITGRPLREIDAYLMPLQLPGAGQHGAELRVRGNETARRRSWPEVAQAAAQLTKRFAGDPELILEDKGAAVALHYRAAPQREDECVAAMRELAQQHRLDLMLGKMVVELRPRGQNKGVAVTTLLARPLFSARQPVFVGDDTTDEDGFARVQALGGYGVKVGAGQSCARYRLDTVADVHRWLGDSAEAVLGPPSERRG